MRGTWWLSMLALSGLAVAVPVEAQRNPRHGGGTSSTATEPPLSPVSGNPVKRTWDFTKRFGIPRFDNRDCASDPQSLSAFVSAFNQSVDQFLAGPTDPKKLVLERARYVRQVLGTEREIAAYLGVLEQTGKRSPDGFLPTLEADICRAQAQRHALIAIREGLNAMRRVYPDMAEVAPRLAQVNAALARIGSDAALQRFVSANRGATLATVRMKPAVSSNPAWEQGLREGFARLVPGETILKLHLYSSGWYVHKNEATSYPEYRQIGAWVAARRADGTCWINGIDLWQNYIGSGFDSGEYKLGGPSQQILCENV